MKFYNDSNGTIVVNLGEKDGLFAGNEIKPGSVDAATEKHVPVVCCDGDKVFVKVGEVTHPSLPEHHIEWIVLETKKGFQIKYLAAGDVPEAAFTLVDDEPVAAYEYCNLHGLWKKEI